MTKVDVVGYMVGDPTPWRAAHTSFLLDASGEKFAYVFQVPKTGNIDRVGFRTGTVSSSQTLRVGIETISSGNPTGTQYGGSAVGTQASPSSNTYYEVTLGTPASATMGDWVAVVIQFNATTGNLNLSANEAWFNQNFPYVVHYTSSWSKSGKHPCGHVRYDDGTYPQIFAVPSASWSFPSFTSASSPDEIGLKFKVPMSCRLKGAWLRIGPGSGTFDVVLYDTDGTTALTTLSVPAGASYGTGNDPYRVLFTDSVSIQAEQWYRLVMKPGASSVSVCYFSVNTAAMLDGFPGSQNFHYTGRTNAGSWTDTTTQRPGFEPFFDQLEDGSAGQRATVVQAFGSF